MSVEISVETLETAQAAAEREVRSATRTLADLETQMADAEALAAVLPEGPEREQIGKQLDRLRNRQSAASSTLQRAQRAQVGVERKLQTARREVAVREREALQTRISVDREAVAALCAEAAGHAEALLRLRGEILTRGGALLQAREDLAKAETLLDPRHPKRAAGKTVLQLSMGKSGLLDLTEKALVWLRDRSEVRHW
jgi:hypothetical protein